MELNIIVDGNVLPARPEANLLETCLAAGLDVPYFCWHPALGSVGACRQCAVKTFRGPDDAAGQIVMACMTPVKAGLRVSIADAQATAFREAVVELVLTSHPHDCPVCEVGGECHLQDMTALTGHTTRRDRFAKRTHLNQDLGPFIKHEMNRCIGCYRCVRFYDDYAGGEDFGVFGANRNVYFGRATEGALESEFAGNLVEVCPTGVFVDKPFSAVFRRKWDMRATPSVCPHCAVGCNITVQERGGKFRRVVNRYSATLNGFFLCDRGRFGAGFIESKQRLRKSRNRAGQVLSHEAARDVLAGVLRQERVVGIGSPRASVEANFALRQVVGPENFYAGVSEYDGAVMAAAVAAMRVTPVANLLDVERADAILLLGDDPLIVAPRLALALRQAAVRPPAGVLAERQIPPWDDRAARTAAAGARNAVMIASAAPTWLDDVASLTIRDTDEAVARFAFAVAESVSAGSSGSAAAEIAQALRNAQAPLVVAGGNAALVLGAANIVLALRRLNISARLVILLPEANSLGLALMAAPPLREALPLRPDTNVIVAENDAFRYGAGAEICAAAKSLVLLDHIETEAVRAADVAVAVGSFADADGTFINMEGRVQRFHKAIFGAEDAPASWAVLRDAAIAAGKLAPGAWATQGALLDALAAEIPVLALCNLPLPQPEQLPTLPHRFSGRTAMDAQFDVREPAPQVHAGSPLGTTMEGAAQTTLAPLLWAPGWNSGQAVIKLQDQSTDLFVFENPAPDAPFFAMPPLPWPERPPALPEELSALSPAIIARRKA
jgi:NADH-quinone oxidoreductase subunit G